MNIRIDRIEEIIENDMTETRDFFIEEFDYYKKELELAESRMKEVLESEIEESSESIDSLGNRIESLSEKVVILGKKIENEE